MSQEYPYLPSVDSPGWPYVTLDRMAKDVYQINLTNGWYEDDRTFFDELFLLTSEVVEAGEAWREKGFEDQTDQNPCSYHHHDWVDDPGDGKGAAIICQPEQAILPKPEGVGSELADVLIRLLDTAARHGIDLTAEYQRKMKYNRTRGYRHGGKRL